MKKIIITICIILLLGVLAFGLFKVFKKNPTVELKQFNDDEKFYSILSTVNKELNDNHKYYTITKMLYKTYDNIDYCFIDGYLLNFPPNEPTTYDDKINYLLLLDNYKYELVQINKENLEEYANNYNDFRKVNSDKKINSVIYSDKNKLQGYIANFLNLTIFDKPKSYELLSNNEKEKIGTEHNYEQQILKYQSISSNISSFTRSGNTYTVIDEYNNTIIITDISTMNYTIEII